MQSKRNDNIKNDNCCSSNIDDDINYIIHVNVVIPSHDTTNSRVILLSLAGVAVLLLAATSTITIITIEVAHSRTKTIHQSKTDDDGGFYKRRTATKKSSTRTTITAQRTTTTTSFKDRKQRRIDGLTPYEKQQVVTWEEVVTMFPNAFEANTSRLKQMASFAEQHSQSTSPPLPPYVSLGFAKEGSTTLHTFLECAVGGETCLFMINGGRGSESIVECFLQTETQHPYDYSNQLMEHCGYPDVCIGYTQMENWAFGRIPQIDNISNLIKEDSELTLFMPFRSFDKWIDSQRRWSIEHNKDSETDRPDMIHGRDGTSPYYGLDAFDTIQPRLWSETEDSFFARQLFHQTQFLNDCIRNKNNAHNKETIDIFHILDQLRGIDEVARLALFKVYYVTYIRSCMQRNPLLTYIEYDLEDPNTGVYLSKIFKVYKRLDCWQHMNASDST